MSLLWIYSGMCYSLCAGAWERCRLFNGMLLRRGSVAGLFMTGGQVKVACMPQNVCFGQFADDPRTGVGTAGGRASGSHERSVLLATVGSWH